MLVGVVIMNRHVGIRNFVAGMTVKIASDDNVLRKEKTFVNKLNLALVQVQPFSLSCKSRWAEAL